MKDNFKNRNNWVIYLLIILVIVFFIKIGFDIGVNYANPCIEYSTDCEIVCSGEGTPAYECFEECPCLQRKFQ